GSALSADRGERPSHVEPASVHGERKHGTIGTDGGRVPCGSPNKGVERGHVLCSGVPTDVLEIAARVYRRSTDGQCLNEASRRRIPQCAARPSRGVPGSEVGDRQATDLEE